MAWQLLMVCLIGSAVELLIENGRVNVIKNVLAGLTEPSMFI